MCFNWLWSSINMSNNSSELQCSSHLTSCASWRSRRFQVKSLSPQLSVILLPSPRPLLDMISLIGPFVTMASARYIPMIHLYAALQMRIPRFSPHAQQMHTAVTPKHVLNPRILPAQWRVTVASRDGGNGDDDLKIFFRW